MGFAKLTLIPDKASYSAIDTIQVIGVQLEGGVSRNRRDFIGGGDSVSVQFTISPTDYTYLVGFYKQAIQQNNIPFDIDLVLDGASLAEYEAFFIPDTLRLSSIKGFRYTVTAKLEVKAPLPNTIADNALVVAFEDAQV